MLRNVGALNFKPRVFAVRQIRAVFVRHTECYAAARSMTGENFEIILNNPLLVNPYIQSGAAIFMAAHFLYKSFFLNRRSGFALSERYALKSKVPLLSMDVFLSPK